MYVICVACAQRICTFMRTSMSSTKEYSCSVEHSLKGGGVTFIFVERQARVVSTMCVIGCSHELNGLAVISL